MSKMTPEKQAADRYPDMIYAASVAGSVALTVNLAKREGYACCIREKVEPLEEWKESAIKVMGEWDKVHEALGKPGKLGESKAAASLAEVVRLRALVQRFVNLMTRPIVAHDAKFDDMKEAQFIWDAAKQEGFVPTNTQDNG